MALTQRFFNPAASGANDGTSELNGWETLADLAAGYAAGQVIECLQPDSGSRYQEGAGADLATSATLNAPVLLRGYTTTPGDGGMCYLDMGVYQLALSGHQLVLSGFDIIGTHVTACVLAGGASGSIRRFKIVNTGVAASSCAAIRATNNANIVGSYLETQNSNAAAAALVATPGGSIFGNYIKKSAGASGTLVAFWIGGKTGIISHCVLDAGSAGCSKAIDITNIASNGNFHGVNNTIYNAATGLYFTAAPAGASDQTPILAANNILYSVTTGMENPAFPATNSYLLVSNNAIGDVTTPYDLGDTPVHGAVTLTEDPFIDKANGDFRLNAAAGGGALCRGMGIGADLLMDMEFGATRFVNGPSRSYLSIGGIMAKGGGGDRRMVIGE